MKVVLLPKINKIEGGIARYGYEIEKRLKEVGIDVQSIPLPTKLPIPLGNHLNVSLVYPFKVFMKSAQMDKDVIFHFLTPEFCSLSFLLKKTIVTFHDLVMINFPEVSKPLSAHHTLSYYLASKFCDLIITNSLQTRKEVESHFPWTRKKVEVVNLGIGEKFFSLSEMRSKLKKIYYGTTEFVIGYLGPLGKRKRVEKLILDFKKNWKGKGILVIWGKGSQEKLLRKISKDDKRIRFMGFAPEEKICEIYNSFDVFVFPTSYEGFGLPIIEAVSCAIPCFIYNDAKISPEIKKFTFSISSVKEIKQIFNTLTSTFLRKMARRVKRRFSWKKTIKCLIKVYEKL